MKTTRLAHALQIQPLSANSKEASYMNSYEIVRLPPSPYIHDLN